MTKYIYVICSTPGCWDNRPLAITQAGLDVADGEVWCETCGEVCQQVQPTDQVLATLGVEPLPGLTSFFQATPSDAGHTREKPGAGSAAD